MGAREITVTLFPPGNAPTAYQKAWGYQARLRVDPSVARLIPRRVAQKLLSVPIARHGPVLTIAMRDPNDLMVYQRLSQITNLRLRAVTASEKEIRRIIQELY